MRRLWLAHGNQPQEPPAVPLDQQVRDFERELHDWRTESEAFGEWAEEVERETDAVLASMRQARARRAEVSMAKAKGKAGRLKAFAETYRPAHGVMCGICKLPPDVQKEINDAMASGTVTQAAVNAWLRELGYKLNHQVIGNHVRAGHAQR